MHSYNKTTPLGVVLFHFGATKVVTDVAGRTGIEPATSAVTGRRSNQLSYRPAVGWLSGNIVTSL